MNFLSELKNNFKIAKKEYLYKLLTSIILRGLLLIIPILFSSAINDVTNNSIKHAIILIIITIIVALLYRLIEGINQKTYYMLYNKLYSYYNSLAISKTNSNSTFSLSRFTLGQYTNIVVTDVDIISAFYSNLVVRFVQMIEFVFILLYFYSIDKFIALAAFILIIIMILIAFKKGTTIQKYNSKRKESLDSMTSSMHEYFNGIREIKSFNFFDTMYLKTKDKTNGYLENNGKYNVVFNSINYMILSVFEISRLLSVIYGINLVSNGNLEIDALLIIYNYYQKIIDNFSTFLTINVEYRNLKVSLQRFYKLIEYSNNKNGKKVLNKDYIGEIVFDNILYGYKDNPTLNNFNVTFKPNSINIIVSDESKTNGIYDLLLRLNRQHIGTITIDGIKITDINDDTYFKLLASSRRNPYFFNMSVKHNLCMDNGSYDLMREICNKLGIEESILKLSNGYDTIIDSNTPINDEMKLLLSIARILIKNSKIMLFDETISNLSLKYKNKLINILKELKNNHTIIISSNDKKFIDIADILIEV